MQGFEPIMAASADKLVQRLDAAATEGGLIDIFPLLQRSTLEVIAISAFGVRHDAMCSSAGDMVCSMCTRSAASYCTILALLCAPDEMLPAQACVPRLLAAHRWCSCKLPHT